MDRSCRAEALDHPPSLVNVSRGVGYLRLRRGEPQQAIPLLERSLLLYRTVNPDLLT